MVNNNRTNDIQLVDIFNRERMLIPSTSFTARDRINGNLGHGVFELSYRIQCAPNYYGSDCNIRCVPTDQFTCDRNGNRVCREGYQNEANGCLDCVSATGCGKYQ